MKRLIKYEKSILFFSLLILVISVLLFFFAIMPLKRSNTPQASSPCNNPNCAELKIFLNEQKVIEKQLKTNDPSEIYAEILAKYAHSPANNQHGIAHIFGEALYKSKGSSGITVCDSSFSFGCFHGFMVNAILQGGIGTVHELDQMCTEKFGQYNLGCQHGIGHGIAEYYGSQNLSKSLDTCNSLSWKHQLMGCTGGVFMEYIMPRLGDTTPGSVQINPLNADNPYAPCLSIKDQFEPECFYNLGNYYYHALEKDSRASLKLCENIPDPFNRKSCLLGLGNSIFSNSRDIPQTLQICKLASIKDNEISCRAGGAWILYANTATRLDAQKMCTDLIGPDLKQCQEDTNLLQLALDN